MSANERRCGCHRQRLTGTLFCVVNWDSFCSSWLMGILFGVSYDRYCVDIITLEVCHKSTYRVNLKANAIIVIIHLTTLHDSFEAPCTEYVT